MWKWGGSACGNGVDLPHVAKHAFGGQMGPKMQKAMPFGSPHHQGQKNCGLPQNNTFLFFDLFLGPTGMLLAVCARLAIFCGWHTIWRFQPHQEGYM